MIEAFDPQQHFCLSLYWNLSKPGYRLHALHPDDAVIPESFGPWPKAHLLRPIVTLAGRPDLVGFYWAVSWHFCTLNVRAAGGIPSAQFFWSASAPWEWK